MFIALLVITMASDFDFQPRAQVNTAPLSQPEPEVVGPSNEELLALRSWSSHGPTFDSDLVTFGRAVWALACSRTPQPSPVPVAERLPGPEDCDAEGRCWLWLSDGYDGVSRWIYVHFLHANDGEYTHWLPHNALPVPGAEVGS